MLVLGLTGGIGSGKSTFAKHLVKRGIPVYNSDDRAKELMHNSEQIKSQLIQNFGSQSYINGQLNRQYLSTLVFGNSQKLQLLNSIVHPVVAKDFEDWKKAQNSPLVFKEAAILFESGAYKQCDLVVNIYADLDQRIERISHRDKISEQEIMQRIDKQWTEEQRMEKADFNIRNNDEDDLALACDNLLKQLNEKKRP